MKLFLVLTLLSSQAMAVSYQQVTNDQGVVSTNTIKRVDDGVFIPTDTGNRDYRDFMAWQKQGNRILPPDPIVVDPGQTKAISDAKDGTKDPQARIDALIKAIDLK